MLSLFSSFDYFWMALPKFINVLTVISLFFYTFSGSFIEKVRSLFYSVFTKFLESLSPLGFKKSVIFIFMVIMVFILVVNFSSVFPFIFAHSAQVGLMFSFGLSIWVGMMFFYNFFNFKSFFSHCVPEGSPLVLSPILFVIEVVSNLIRPITLTVRLVANILAGHLLLILLSKIVYLYSFSYPFYLGLNLVEFFVALIQAYIFVTMITLYYCDLS